MKRKEMETRIEILENQLDKQQEEIWALQNEGVMIVVLLLIIFLVFGFAIYGFATIMNLL